MRDPEQMSHEDKLNTLFGVGGADPMPWRIGMEYEPRELDRPSALLAWYLAGVSFLLFPVVVVAVPVAVRAARRGNPVAWLAAAAAVAGATASFVLLPAMAR